MIARPVPQDLAEPFFDELVGDEMGVDATGDGQWFGVGDPLDGVCRVQERGGFHLLDDVWVKPDLRRRGLARALVDAARAWVGDDELWLLCDEDMVSYYERRGFVVRAPEDLPKPLAELCEQKGEWPRAHDHVHIAMSAQL